MRPVTATEGSQVLSTRIGLRRIAAVAVAMSVLTGVVVVPIAAATSSVSGSLTYREKVALTPAAVAIVTIIDNPAAPDAGVIVGEQVIHGPTALPVDFSVLVEAGTIQSAHSYSLYATIIDGASTWHNPVGEPVITGGPTKGVDLTLTAVPQAPGAAVTGTIVPPSGVSLAPGGVVIAALVNVETGTILDRVVLPQASPSDLAFSIGYDPSLIHPDSTYVVKGAVVDGPKVYGNREGVTAISKSAAKSTVTMPVTLAPTGIPGESPIASSSPAPTAAPSAVPSAAPTAAPTAAASAAPTAAPTAAPSTAPTAAPTPTPAPTAAPTATPA